MIQPPSFALNKHSTTVSRLKKPQWSHAGTACLAFKDHPISPLNRILNVEIGQLPVHQKQVEQPDCHYHVRDDSVMRGKNLVDINQVKMLLSNRFEMKDMHELHYFLGIEVIRTPVGIMSSQWHYVLNLLYKFGMIEFKPMSTPLDRNLKIDANFGTTNSEPTQYRQLIHSLIY